MINLICLGSRGIVEPDNLAQHLHDILRFQHSIFHRDVPFPLGLDRELVNSGLFYVG